MPRTKLQKKIKQLFFSSRFASQTKTIQTFNLRFFFVYDRKWSGMTQRMYHRIPANTNHPSSFGKKVSIQYNGIINILFDPFGRNAPHLSSSRK